MNTGTQDSINLAWKLAMVIRGRASHELLDTYGADRLPAIRNVLTKTEVLAGATGSDNPVFRTIFNFVAPLVVGREFVQKASTARMSQIGLNYRESPLSETHARPGELRAGDRVPDMALVSAGKSARLFGLLDPSRLTVVLVRPDGYVGFLGDARPARKLVAYLGKWFKNDEVPPAGGPRRGWHAGGLSP